MPVRPTLRCLRGDLHVPLPPASIFLDQIDHPLLAKTGEQFADPDTPHERIPSIDDVVLFKVKAGRWRGATYLDQNATEARDWLVAAGRRENGSVTTSTPRCTPSAAPPGSATTPSTTSR
ncbi:hypothetical protein [Frankia sp. AgB32]|uniref:hypothetical protein n=1 Tax=Frankia sp. AgB32 TaxID=631119 RepID=UPI00200C977C|nr:hypothetical protein [Frankia sp. AgB32]MCK9894103.1 hypothetical protein [Frankia sp. AgB32]